MARSPLDYFPQWTQFSMKPNARTGLMGAQCNPNKTVERKVKKMGQKTQKRFLSYMTAFKRALKCEWHYFLETGSFA